MVIMRKMASDEPYLIGLLDRFIKYNNIFNNTHSMTASGLDNTVSCSSKKCLESSRLDGQTNRQPSSLASSDGG